MYLDVRLKRSEIGQFSGFWAWWQTNKQTHGPRARLTWSVRKGLVPFTQLVKVRRVTWFWHFQASDFHETFTRSSLALNMSRKLVSDPYLAIHGKIMAKNGHFFMEFWPIFDIFHWLRPYLCSKRAYLGFHKQATHRRHDDEPFFHSGVDRSWLGMA